MQKSFFLKLSGREEGPYSETQIGQMFADQRVDRNTPCRLAAGSDWKMIDDYLPTLKYGTQLPPSTPKPVSTPAIPSANPTVQRFALVDLDIPFGSLLKMMFKWAAAAFIVFCCFIPAMVLLWAIVMLILATFVGGMMSNFHHP